MYYCLPCVLKKESSSKTLPCCCFLFIVSLLQIPQGKKEKGKKKKEDLCLAFEVFVLFLVKSGSGVTEKGTRGVGTSFLVEHHRLLYRHHINCTLLDKEGLDRYSLPLIFKL
eukprot:TRINITY_DN8937_c0_g1_i1.p1 TRINITY_DN8937_c0_g1~~TRINITY_DN8937_c0_g1_i1.p1  ORF type:complete len:112 (+),score=11.82 TRINITY_DN8937_c0_g1_i1:1757-2092(+)